MVSNREWMSSVGAWSWWFFNIVINFLPALASLTLAMVMYADIPLHFSSTDINSRLDWLILDTQFTKLNLINNLSSSRPNECYIRSFFTTDESRTISQSLCGRHNSHYRYVRTISQRTISQSPLCEDFRENTKSTMLFPYLLIQKVPSWSILISLLLVVVITVTLHLSAVSNHTITTRTRAIAAIVVVSQFTCYY